MHKWEYASIVKGVPQAENVSINWPGRPPTIALFADGPYQFANDLGGEGWELAAATVRGDVETWVFKRPAGPYPGKDSSSPEVVPSSGRTSGDAP